MAKIAIPVIILYELPDELAAAIRTRHHSYRLRLVPRGDAAVWVEVLVLPHGTDGWEPVSDCCHVCLQFTEPPPDPLRVA